MNLLAILCVCPMVMVLVSGSDHYDQEQAQCAKDLAKVQRSAKRPGMFVPTCTKAGWFAAKQCQGPSCWCVFPDTGKEVAGTRTKPGSNRAVVCPKCLKDQAAALPEPGFAGAFVAKCDEHGNYAPLQFHGSTGYSWCVNRQTGAEVAGTRVGPGRGGKPPKCA